MDEQSGGAFSDINELQSYFESVDRRLEEEIASRPVALRLPRKGCRFRALRDTVVDVVTYFRGGDDGLFIPIQIKQGTIPQEEVIRLDYEPVPSESTHCSLVPEQYGELEMSLVDAEFRKDPEYSGFNFSVSYLQLDKDFDWLED
jgi:hypothetical protein